MKINYYLESMQGIRAKNDDRASVFQNEKATLAILCDGIGGHSFGDEAAQTVIDTFKQEFIHNFYVKNNLTAKQWVFSVFDKAKSILKQLSTTQVGKESMGTTAVGCLILNETQNVIIFNSGDSRCYIAKEHELVQVTIDHNVENQLISEGEDIEKYNPEMRKYLTSAILPNYNTLIEIFEVSPKGFHNIKKILLTSDGIHGFMSKSELEYFILQDKPLKEIAKEVLDLAIVSESTDNMTLVILDVEQGGNNGN
ncbi:PP2C family protein-serine/threonine phosphatase [Mycoplasma sp. HF11B]|uniref:PP2C family protein-serine/threonine phosphatase n=1 Tax=unclassified Mycoplasma TaxID=2683645 RepID=UPI003AAF97FA